MQAGRYADPAEDYETTAEAVARDFGKPISPMLIAASYRNVQPHVLEAIEANPHEWDQRVNDYCYGLAMGKATHAV